MKYTAQQIKDHAATCHMREAFQESDFCGKSGAIIDQLVTRITELEKDAARYRWLREQHWATSHVCVVENPKSALKLGAHCPSREFLDTEIDIAIKQGR